MNEKKLKELLTEELILTGITHENAPPNKECLKDCNVLKDKNGDYIKGYGEIKHRRCMECWGEYVNSLCKKILSLSVSEPGSTRKPN